MQILSCSCLPIFFVAFRLFRHADAFADYAIIAISLPLYASFITADVFRHTPAYAIIYAHTSFAIFSFFTLRFAISFYIIVFNITTIVADAAPREHAAITRHDARDAYAAPLSLRPPTIFAAFAAAADAMPIIAYV